MAPSDPTMQQTDHDTLIRVEAVLNNLVSEVKNANSSLNAQVLEHELRIRSIEKIHDQVNPIESRSQLEDLLTWRNGQKVERRVLVAISTAVGSIITLIALLVGAFTNVHFH